MILHVPTSLRACTVAAGVISLLRSLQVEIIAEGVESSHQAVWLHKYPDVRMQGFYFRRPVTGLEWALSNVADPPVFA
jgi:EAL domain-containing protein (putative c-di-GMP-specific phosphodiesterase class I)